MCELANKNHILVLLSKVMFFMEIYIYEEKKADFHFQNVQFSVTYDEMKIGKWIFVYVLISMQIFASNSYPPLPKYAAFHSTEHGCRNVIKTH